MDELHIIYLPVWLQVLLSIGSIYLLWKLLHFGDCSVPGCGWVGHGEDEDD